ncbi:transcription factor RelB homolog isoform X1 [Girardinichthys multiradiatus]|uniref:transcription factor RelB homolog isoform X1 n=2 Tax=Girardinichthys multiradiatus TaxID=208333 RepID=UPI001FAB98E0|nr:transcription factor RelB homolog isoform X1 [Girardinichthys multiradiatus]
MKDMDFYKEEPTPNSGINTYSHRSVTNGELDLIVEIINGCHELQQGSLPGPPPPPSPDPYCQSLLNQNNFPPQQNPQSTSKPVLVPRGTAPRSRPMSEMASAPSSHLSGPPMCSTGRGRGPSGSLTTKGSVPSQGLQSNANALEQILEKPRLVVVEEPKDRGMRFRYECEGRSAGSILGASSTDNNKTQPTIEIQGPINHLKKVTVTVSLITKDLPHRPHPHCLVGKDCVAGSGICVVSFNPNTTRRHSFANLGIQCVRRRELDVSLQRRRSQNIDPFKTGHTKGIEDMDMNAVRLCFECLLEWDDGRKDSLFPVVSKPIYDKKATTTSELKICQLNLNRGSCKGKTEVYMLCDKVQKDDIEILFREGSWKANGEFAQTDVHRQIAIVFKTPPYQDQDITEEVEVSIVLRRVSDQMESEPVSFTYLPYNPDPYGVKRKRTTIKRDISVTEPPPPSEQTFNFHVMPSDESQHPIMPAAETGLLDPSSIDEQIVFSELLHFLSEQNLPTDMDTNSAVFPITNMNFNANYNTCPPDFSQFNDIQFNMLFNDNQIAQSEQQDSVIQVKAEEEL